MGQDAIMNSRKERFHVEQAKPSDDQPVGEGAFEHALGAGSGPTKAFQMDHPGGADRSAGWITTKDGVNAPEVQPGAGAFDAALSSNKPSSNFSNNRPVRTPVKQASPEFYSDANTGSLAASVHSKNTPSSTFSNRRPVRSPVQQAQPESSGARPSAFKGF